ncbi:hypothetical protein EV702DRAFT_1200889 [Suillus placidus]|uniref:CxC2-like cysteine cluster KDZ transposase-associated domain-containing protein n=1 Tax=Suillus placidus TaxID=48579 RepID=A0A9P6ZNP3_9AGAM|nr:hypothetical protein EV702DRAFT_1200889 [Suillus placidus]
MPRGTGASRLKGLSRSIISHHFRGRLRQTHVLTAGKQGQRLEAAAASRQAQVQEMSAEDREMQPPGDEGLDMSHAGGEYEAFEGLAHEVAGISRMEMAVPHHGMPPSPSDDDGQRVSLSEIELIDIFTRRRSSLRSQPHHQYPNETLIHHGYLGCPPLYPTVAISLHTLAAYRQTHRCIDQRLCTALKRDTPNWRLLNTCPACFYKLEDEPDLDFDWLVTMDGNNSLKRWDSTIYGTNARVDSRKVRSDFWIDPNTVDKFNGEVRAHAATPNQGDNALVDNMAVKTNPAPFSCADRWKNAGPEMRKKMFSVFDESGIFIAACRHRFVLLACDMIRSGELAKYPLAIIDKLLAVYGKGGACAYDIGCAFMKTLGMLTIGNVNSTGIQCIFLELDIAKERGANISFQHRTHSLVAPGMQARFIRHQVIEQHFAFWNDDKYAALSNFLWNHYPELDITNDDFPRYILQERAYLDSLKQLPTRDQICMRYVEALDELAERKTCWDSAREFANNALTGIATGSLEQINEALAQARIRVDSSYAKLQHAEMLVAHVEHQLAVEGWWEIGGDEYNRFKMEACLGKYCTALDDLECLIVMRLFELSKLSLSGTGYKLCQQIGKALQWRSEAIRNAINCYNVQAVALNPPCPKISWKDIADYSFLGDEDWAKPAHREATTKYFKLCRAHEELMRLNVEIRRLRTAIHAEQVQTTAVIEDLRLSDLKLAEELQRQWCSRAAINAVHLHRLDHIECLAGFSGVRGVGVRVQLTSTTPAQNPSMTVNAHTESVKLIPPSPNFHAYLILSRRR